MLNPIITHSYLTLPPLRIKSLAHQIAMLEMQRDKSDPFVYARVFSHIMSGLLYCYVDKDYRISFNG
jgi:hypothetical protein